MDAFRPVCYRFRYHFAPGRLVEAVHRRLVGHWKPSPVEVDGLLDRSATRLSLRSTPTVSRAFSNQDRTVITVLHSTATIKQLCIRAVYLRGGRVVCDGTPDEVVARYKDDVARDRGRGVGRRSRILTVPPTTSSPTGGRLWRALSLGAAALFPLYILRLIARASDLQFYDYWWVLQQLFRPDGSLDLAGLLARRNEHLIVVPKLLYVANVYLTDGKNRPLGVFSLLLAGVCLWLCLRLLPPSARETPGRQALWLLVAAALVFTPQAAHNFTLGMSGVAWLTANALTLAAILASYANSPPGPWSWR